jgi:hypothetical protein
MLERLSWLAMGFAWALLGLVVRLQFAEREGLPGVHCLQDWVAWVALFEVRFSRLLFFGVGL